MNITTIPSKIISFLKEVRLEMKKVNWPTREEVIKYTIIIVGVCIAVAVYLGGLDLIFSNLIEKLILFK